MKLGISMFTSRVWDINKGTISVWKMLPCHWRSSLLGAVVDADPCCDNLTCVTTIGQHWAATPSGLFGHQRPGGGSHKMSRDDFLHLGFWMPWVFAHHIDMNRFEDLQEKTGQIWGPVFWAKLVLTNMINRIGSSSQYQSVSVGQVLCADLVGQMPCFVNCLLAWLGHAHGSGLVPGRISQNLAPGIQIRGWRRKFAAAWLFSIHIIRLD